MSSPASPARARTTVTARGLPPEAWHPVLATAPPVPALPAAGTTVAVVAAHPDDETLAAAGLLLRLAVRGVRVRLVLVTDGEAAYPDRGSAERAALAACRRTESRRALTVTGHPHAPVTHLGLPDGDVAEHEAWLAEELTAVLDGAAMCLVPWEHDPHPDHRASGRAALRAVAAVDAGGRPVTAWRYPVWMRHATPPAAAPPELRAFRLTTEEIAAKRDAIACHDSQLRSPWDGCGPVLPDHVLALFDDGVEPFLVGSPARPPGVRS
jgi:LmbE family N-acetylglucosaminyl deacetylase